MGIDKLKEKEKLSLSRIQSQMKMLSLLFYITSSVFIVFIIYLAGLAYLAYEKALIAFQNKLIIVSPVEVVCSLLYKILPFEYITWMLTVLFLLGIYLFSVKKLLGITNKLLED